MLQHSAVNENPFTLSTDMAVVNDLNSNVPITMRHGIIGRIVSLYGGEVKCEGWNIRILGKRGADRGFSIRYGNNLVDMKQDEDISGIYDGVYPYYNVEETEETDAVYVELPEKVILLGKHSERIKPINLTAEFTEEPTEEELRAKTLEYLEKNGKMEDRACSHDRQCAEIYLAEDADATPRLFDIGVHVLQLGDIVFVGLPGEIFSEIGLQIKALSPFAHTVVVELADGWHGYIAPDYVLRAGCYETIYSNISYTGLGTADILVDGAVTMLKGMYEAHIQHRMGEIRDNRLFKQEIK